MNKIISIILSAALPLSMASTAFAEVAVSCRESQYTVYIDDVLADVNNMNFNEVEMLPMKEMCVLLGYELAEEAGGRVTITEGENCINDGPVKIEFNIGDYYITYIDKLGYVNKNEKFSRESMTIKHGDDIYISPYDFCRVFGTKNVLTGEDKKIAVETTGYRDEKLRYGIDFNGNLFVKSFDGELRIELDGRALEFTSKPFIDEEGRTQVPVREFCEQLNYGVRWFEDPDRVCISTVPPDLDKSNGGSAGGASFWFTIGEKQYRRNGTYYDMDTAAQIIDGKTYVPLRYLAQAARYSVAYNPGSHSIRFIGFGYRTLHSYLGKDKAFVLGELGLDESHIASQSDKHSDYVANNIVEPYNQTSVNVSFDNDILSGFAYICKDYETAYTTVKRISEYFNKIYGKSLTNNKEEHNIDDLTETEPEKWYEYSDKWDAHLSDKALNTLFGSTDSSIDIVLKLNKYPEGYFVFVEFCIE